nr:hypothetical protein [uncultured Cohaesibacter sp.]
MSGLRVVPALYNPADRSSQFQRLLIDGRAQAERSVVPVERSDAPVPVSAALQYATNQQAYIQAQILSSELSRINRRHSAARSPREAARAYGQARRRPQTVADMPVLRNVI